MSEFEKELIIKVMEEKGWIEPGALNNSSSYEVVEESGTEKSVLFCTAK